MSSKSSHKTKKRFGQHFLNDSQIIQQIINAVQLADDQTLIEIGPGQGAITMPLLEKYKKLTAIELDRDLIEPLTQQSKRYGELNLINEDILNIDFNSRFKDQSLSVVGNLPYNISTPLMFHLMQSSSQITSMTFMVQQEVANRITAPVGHSAYGRLSVMMQYYCHCNYLFLVPPESFSPPPKVDSAVILLTPHNLYKGSVKDKNFFDLLVKTAFNQRRKTIRNSLGSLVSEELLKHCGINPKLRAENLSLSEYINIANTVHDHA